MFDYAVCQIAGKQVIAIPGKEITVPSLGEISDFTCEKVILISKKNQINLGTPFLKEKLKFEVLGQVSGKKIRVAFYKPKANHRKATGHKAQFSKIRLSKVS